MTTADWAFVVSLASLAISLAAFVWNVWSKFIFPKPKVLVTFAFNAIYQAGKKTGNVLRLDATNLGPGQITLHTALCRNRPAWLRWFGIDPVYALLNPLHDYPLRIEHSIGPFGGGLPKKVEVGETFAVYLTPHHDELAATAFDVIGFNDTFGRFHWAPRTQLRKAQGQVRQFIKDEDAKKSPPSVDQTCE